MDGGGFDIDGGSSDVVIEHCLSFGNAGPGYLVCQFGGDVRPTANNTIRYSVSLNDTRASSNGASGLNFWASDVSLAGFTGYGNTFVGSSKSYLPVLGLTGGSAPLRGVTLLNNTFLSLGSAPGPTMALQPEAGLAANGQAYWPAAWEWAGKDFSSLAAFRAASGLETAPDGAPTGTAADPQVSWAPAGGFFAGCVAWAANVSALLQLPALPDSPLWDAVRGFSGCGA